MPADQRQHGHRCRRGSIPGISELCFMAAWLIGGGTKGYEQSSEGRAHRSPASSSPTPPARLERRRRRLPRRHHHRHRRGIRHLHRTKQLAERRVRALHPLLQIGQRGVFGRRAANLAQRACGTARIAPSMARDVSYASSRSAGGRLHARIHLHHERLRLRLAVDRQPHRVGRPAAPTIPNGTRGVFPAIAAIGYGEVVHRPAARGARPRRSGAAPRSSAAAGAGESSSRGCCAPRPAARAGSSLE